MCKRAREEEAKATGADSIRGYVGKVEGVSWVMFSGLVTVVFGR